MIFKRIKTTYLTTDPAVLQNVLYRDENTWEKNGTRQALAKGSKVPRGVCQRIKHRIGPTYFKMITFFVFSEDKEHIFTEAMGAKPLP